MENKITFLILFLSTFLFGQNRPTYKDFIKSDSAMFYYTESKKPENSNFEEKYLDKAISFENSNFYLKEQKSGILYRKKDFENYKKFLSELIKEFPTKGELNFQLGFVYEKEKQAELASKNYEIAVQKFSIAELHEKDQNVWRIHFQKMITLLLLNKKDTAKIYIAKFSDEEDYDSLKDYYDGLVSMEREKLFSFIENDLK